MGHAIGRVLHEHGMRVITTVRDRSERTRSLARMAGFQAVVDDDTLVREADILLSILPPAMAYSCATATLMIGYSCLKLPLQENWPISSEDPALGAAYGPRNIAFYRNKKLSYVLPLI